MRLAFRSVSEAATADPCHDETVGHTLVRRAQVTGQQMHDSLVCAPPDSKAFAMIAKAPRRRRLSIDARRASFSRQSLPDVRAVPLADACL
jgi:hypothetical protein